MSNFSSHPREEYKGIPQRKVCSPISMVSTETKFLGQVTKTLLHVGIICVDCILIIVV